MLPRTAAAPSARLATGARRVPLESTADSAPTAKRSESPGRNGVTTNPVSAKITAKRIG
jgi:hypothetical protein